MKPENKELLVKYSICFCVASLIAVCVFWSKGFFEHSTAVNVQVLADGFFVAGALMTLFAGMMYVAGEGALLGVGFIIKTVIQTFIPMGRKNHEFYAQYRERKLAEAKKRGLGHILWTGLAFLSVGILFTVIWYVNFYTPPMN